MLVCFIFLNCDGSKDTGSFTLNVFSVYYWHQLCTFAICKLKHLQPSKWFVIFNKINKNVTTHCRCVPIFLYHSSLLWIIYGWLKISKTCTGGMQNLMSYSAFFFNKFFVCFLFKPKKYLCNVIAGREPWKEDRKQGANNTGLHHTTRTCHPPHTTSGSEPVNYSEFLTKNYNTLKINLINQLWLKLHFYYMPLINKSYQLWEYLH